MTFIDPEAKVLMDGLPAFVGKDEIQTVVELLNERASHIEIEYEEVEAMDKDANFVYGTLRFEFFNESGEKYIGAT